MDKHRQRRIHGTVCSVKGCRNNTFMNKEVSFHRFPKNNKLATQWLRCIDPLRKDFSRYASKRICGVHFNRTGKKTKADKYPIYLVPHIQVDQELTKEEEKAIHNIDHTEEVSYELEIIPLNNEIPSINTNDVTSYDHTYAYREGNADAFKGMQQYICSLEKENEVLKLKLQHMNTTKSPIRIDYDEIINDQYMLNFCTQFADRNKYNAFVTIMKSLAEMYLIQNRKCRRPSQVSHNEQIFLVLTRLRLGVLENDLAIRHNIRQSTVSKICSFWINIMFAYFKQLPIWPTRKIVQEFMPDCFKRRYPSTRVILDGTEIFIQKPSDYNVQSATYSHYKSHNTARGIVGITPNGFLSHVTDLFPGRISEKQIIISSGLLNKLEPGDSVMADRGFLLTDELRTINVDLNIPPFVNRLPQFSLEDEQLTRDIATVRIHVERTIRDIKIYRILTGTFPNNSIDQLNKIWTICCHLVNITNVPLLNR